MNLLHLLQPLLCAGLSKAYLVAPPGTAAPGAIQQCSGWVQASYALTCDIIVRMYGMTLPQFQEWNPATTLLGPGCNLISGLYFCTEVDFISYTTTSNIVTSPQPTSSSFSTTIKTSSTSTISTPTPTQSGMVANCNRSYYVNPGDNCANIASAQGIALADLYAWNPAVGNNCQGLWAYVYICVGVAGTPPPSTTTTTTSGNGIVTPTPTQSGMVTNCNRFYFVNSGDGCANIASSQGIALADLYAWNPAIGNNCGGLWANVYICVGVSGTTPTPTTTSSGNGVATPTPIQAGMTTRCKTFYRVVSGDGCWAIANAAGISLENFYAWNPAVGTNCATLWPDYYVCIAIL